MEFFGYVKPGGEERSRTTRRGAMKVDEKILNFLIHPAMAPIFIDFTVFPTFQRCRRPPLGHYRRHAACRRGPLDP